ncbi:MAG: hypothetical protein RBT87_05230 [bacterium]|nr:hypothetical protein [bacterium]
MFKNHYLREKLIGSHKTLINCLNEKDLIDSLQLIVAMVGPANDDHIPKDAKYKKELIELVDRFVFLRDDINVKKDKDYLEKLRELASDFVKFEFKVEQETE